MESLTDEQLTALTDSLSVLQQELEALLSATEVGAKPVKLKDNQGRLSRMDELHNQSILMANRNVTQNRLRAVLAAFVRIENGSYSFCTQCDESIPINRLQAYPEAPMCIECQSEAESL